MVRRKSGEVQANGIALQTEDVSYKQTIDSQQITEMPINSAARQITGLLTVSGGTNPAPGWGRRAPARCRYPSVMAGPGTALRFWHLPTDGALHGPALDSHLLLNLWIALGLFALANILLVIGVISRRRAHRPIHKFTLEYLPLTAFAATFLLLGVRSNSVWATQRYTGAAPDALQVEVTGLQFAWYFRYPGLDATFGRTRNELVSAAEGNPVGLDPADSHGNDDIVRPQLVLPAGREVDLTLRAVDVIHGFAIPEMRLKQNAVPGETQHIHFTPIQPGDYAILCTQVCGLGHYRMQATLRVLSAEQFELWLHQQEQAQTHGGQQ